MSPEEKLSKAMNLSPYWEGLTDKQKKNRLITLDEYLGWLRRKIVSK